MFLGGRVGMSATTAAALSVALYSVGVYNPLLLSKILWTVPAAATPYVMMHTKEFVAWYMTSREMSESILKFEECISRGTARKTCISGIAKRSIRQSIEQWFYPAYYSRFMDEGIQALTTVCESGSNREVGYVAKLLERCVNEWSAERAVKCAEGARVHATAFEPERDEL